MAQRFASPRTLDATMPLTPEDLETVKRKIAEIRAVFGANQTFAYSQTALLGQTSDYRKSNGVCFGMSVDWLRRKLWNVYNPSAKQKRGFDDAKYLGSRQAQVKLTTKHGQLQDVYKAVAAKNSGVGTQTVLTRFVGAGIVHSGMDHLRATQVSAIHSYELDEQAWIDTGHGITRTGTPNAHYAFKQKMASVLDDLRGKLSTTAPAIGLLISLNGNAGHAVAFFFRQGQDRFFDPNLGEYDFGMPAQRSRELSFISDLWFDVYHRFFKMDNVEFIRFDYN